MFLATHGESLCEMLTLTIGKVRPRGAKYVGLILESLLREYPSDGGLLLLRSGILETMLRSCSSSYSGSGQCEPDRVIALYLNSLARVLSAAPGICDSLLPLVMGEGIGERFSYKELVSYEILDLLASSRPMIETHAPAVSQLELYMNLLNSNTSDFSVQLWLKLLLSLLPSQSHHPDSNLSLALADLISEFVSRFIEVVSKITSARSPENYQVEYDSDEETIDIGIHQYEVMLKNSQLKVGDSFARRNYAVTTRMMPATV